MNSYRIKFSFSLNCSLKHLYCESKYEILKGYRVCWVEREIFQFSYCQCQTFSEIGSDSPAMCVYVIYIYIHVHIHILYVYIKYMEWNLSLMLRLQSELFSPISRMSKRTLHVNLTHCHSCKMLFHYISNSLVYFS